MYGRKLEESVYKKIRDFDHYIKSSSHLSSPS